MNLVIFRYHKLPQKLLSSKQMTTETQITGGKVFSIWKVPGGMGIDEIHQYRPCVG